jgi:prepilin-type N-terminal cleavage/methylation domain-containing protein
MMNTTYKKEHKSRSQGFTITELTIVVAIIGALSAMAIPSYVSQLRRTQLMEAESTVSSIQAIISAYTDETGEMPNTWEQINSITAIMASNGDGTSSQAKSNDLKEIVLPGDHYKLKINAPSGTDTVYTLTANPLDANSNYDIRSCLDISNGASDLTTGSSSEKAQAPACS